MWVLLLLLLFNASARGSMTLSDPALEKDPWGGERREREEGGVISI